MADKVLKIKAFTGVDQSAGALNQDAGSSPDSLNFVCRYGAMRVSPGITEIYAELPTACERLFQGFFRDSGGADYSVPLACGGGGVYAYVSGAWTALGTGFASDEWSAVNYRHGDSDLIILVNGVDGAVKWDGATATLTSLTTAQGGANIVFSQLTLIYERLWGAVYSATPDRVYWSEAFGPDDWEINYASPASGGGFMDVATFDGARIRAIVAAFDDVLIFKDRSVHRLNGTYPGEFSLTQAYGSEGTLAPRTIVHTADRLFFLSAEGLCAYDGMTVSTLASRGDRKLCQLWKELNLGAITSACAAICDDVLYLAVPTGQSQTNTRVIEYSLRDGAYSVNTLSGVSDWLVLREGQRETLLCLIGKKVYRYGEGATFAGGAVDAIWTSPELSLGTLTSKKRTGRVLMAVNADAATRVKLTALSGGRERSRTVSLTAGLNYVRGRVRIRGRTFRLRIENVSGGAFTLNRGVEIGIEEDESL